MDGLQHIEQMEQEILNGASLSEICNTFKVSRQQLYKIFRRKHGIGPKDFCRRNLKAPPPSKTLWLKRVLSNKGKDKNKLFLALQGQLPDVCPILGIPLDYFSGRDVSKDSGPSIDRINPLKGYVVGNVWIISFRANRLKNDATPEELQKLAYWMKEMTSQLELDFG